MKWAILGLTLLGVAAATCAALLVGSLRAGSLQSDRRIDSPDAQVHVLYAKKPLESMTVIDGEMVGTKALPRREAPPQFISDPVQVVGRVLTVPLLEGQAFSKSAFASDSNASVAAAVAKGKRAVGISVTSYGGLEGLLYPGSVVDVFVTFDADTAAGLNPADTAPVTLTLLERVQVLAIERQTVVSGSSEKVGRDVDSTERIARAGDSRRVTLLVDTRQAKILQLAMEQGVLSLALRNPLDGSEGNRDAISLSTILGTKPGQQAAPSTPSAWDRMLLSLADAMRRSRSIPVSAVAPKPDAPRWETTVIRGDAVQTYSFPMNEAAVEGQTAGRSSPQKDGITSTKE